MQFGNSSVGLMSFLQNKSSLSKFLYVKNQVSIILGYDNLKANYSYFLQNIVRFLSKKSIRQTKSGNFFGVLHSNIGSLNLCFLGLKSSIRSSVYINNRTTYEGNLIKYGHDLDLKKGSYDFTNSSNVISINSHKENFSNSNVLTIPTKTFFEQQLLTFDANQILHKSNKVVNSTIKTINFSTFLYL